MISELSAVPGNDIYIVCCHEKYDWVSEDGYLLSGIQKEIEWTETVMCEANAQNFYQIICNLEYAASVGRTAYEKWKKMEFKKSDDN